MSNMQIDENDLATNPTPRVPICLLLDTSYSMTGAPIDELNEGVKLFIEALKSDEIACYSADVTVITFGGSVDTCAPITAASITCCVDRIEATSTSVSNS